MEQKAQGKGGTGVAQGRLDAGVSSPLEALAALSSFQAGRQAQGLQL